MEFLISRTGQKVHSATPFSFLSILFSFAFLIFFVSGTARAAPVNADWELVDGATVNQGSVVFDRRSRSYRVSNAVSVPADANFTDGVRLFIVASSHMLTNADGELDGIPYFDLVGTTQDVLISFALKRGPLSYTAEVQQPVTDIDSDGDGIPDDLDVCPLDPGNDDDGDGICLIDDLCPDDFDNLCFTINGLVLGNGAALSGASVTVGTNTQTGSTGGAGGFSIAAGPVELAQGPTGKFFPVQVSLGGYANGLKKVPLVTGVTEYTVTLNMQQHSTVISEEDDINDGLAIIKNGSPVGSLKIPDASLPTDVTSISGNVTYLAPGSDDLLSMPGGDLLAIPIGADPNDEPVTLETFGMMEFNLFDQNGDPISELGGEAEVCMAATPSLSEGDTVELWHYDEEAGVWIEEGAGTVVLRDGLLQICGSVTHFTWWNYDRPISTHACLRYTIEAANGTNQLDGISWYADGATYNGSSPGRNCAGASDNFDSFSVKKSDGGFTESIRIYAQIAGVRYYLIGDVTQTQPYTLSTNVASAAVFTVPTDQGSCISGSQSGICTLIDYQSSAPDGVLQVDSDIDLPPVISDFSLIQGLIFAGGQSPVSAMVTDPDGLNVNVLWSVDCNYYGASDGGSMSPTNASGVSGSTFNATFNAPSILSSFISYCSVEISAEDAAGNITTATQWVTIAQSSVINVSGILYGTDGQPMGNTVINYDNPNCSANVFQQITTDSNGQFDTQIDLALCDFGGNDFYFWDLGFAYVDYMQGGNVWTSYYPLQSGNNGGEFLAAATTVDNEPSGCNVSENGSANCNVNIYLPVLWADISGDIGLPTSDEDYLLDIYVDSYGGGEFNGGFFGEANQLFNLPIAANTSQYGPIAVPVGEGNLVLSGVTGIDTFSQDFELVNILPTRLDIGEILADVQVTVQDDLADTSVSLYENESGASTNGTTGPAGEAHTFADVTVGGIQVESNSPYYSFYGYLQDSSTPMLVDLGGSELCTVNLSLYSPRRELLGYVAEETAPDGTVITPEIVRTIYGYNQNSSFSLELDENGMGTFEVSPGYLYLDYYGVSQSPGDGYYGFVNTSIANCRGNPSLQLDMSTSNSSGLNLQ